MLEAVSKVLTIRMMEGWRISPSSSHSCCTSLGTSPLFLRMRFKAYLSPVRLFSTIRTVPKLPEPMRRTGLICFKVRRLSCSWMFLASISSMHLPTMPQNTVRSTVHSSAWLLATSTVADRRSLNSTARSPKAAFCPSVRTLFPSQITATSPEATAKNAFPISPCVKTLSPSTYLLNARLATRRSTCSSDTSRSIGTRLRIITFRKYAKTSSVALAVPLLVRARAKPSADNVAKRQPFGPATSLCTQGTASLGEAKMGKPASPMTEPCRLSDCASLLDISASVASWQHCPRFNVRVMPPMLPMTSPSSTIETTLPSGVLSLAPKLLVSSSSTMHCSWCFGRDEKAGILLITESWKPSSKPFAKSGPST
mmetsp:Transcript_118679/g.335684  ORF Transcript_118679/g.335684 Transcript_118679/m.335684 type:complete len:368 (-) Transcript_118679:1119-2222(-)